jgi:vacuolar-type H+-ATPase subunit I/STV1
MGTVGRYGVSRQKPHVWCVQGGSTDLALLEEKDQAISEYRSEGEKLMAKTMELEGFLKKARAQLKKTEAEKAQLAAQLKAHEAEASTEVAERDEELEELQTENANIYKQLTEQRAAFERELAAARAEVRFTWTESRSPLCVGVIWMHTLPPAFESYRRVNEERFVDSHEHTRPSWQRPQTP